MSTLNKPKFKKLVYSSFGGAPLLKSLWDHFDFSLLIRQSGINKRSGVPTWQLSFLFVVGLLAQCSSCVQMVDFYSKDRLLQSMFYGKSVTQSVFSRFMSSFAWERFNLKRVQRFQEDPDTKLEDGDIIALDDTQVPHNHAKNIPFVYRLFDHSAKQYVKAMNLVVLHALKSTGLQYPVLYSIWKKDNKQDEHLSKLDLALNMLKQLKSHLSKQARLWIAMDSWYFAKNFFLEIEELGFHWVTRAKKNSKLYRKVTIRGKERFITVLPEALYKEAKPVFSFWRKEGPLCMEFKDIYLKVDEIHNGQGYLKEPVLKPIKAVVSAYLEKDQETGETKETFALILSSRLEASAIETVQAYKKRWSIEIFFRNAKQELGLNNCHSTNEKHIHAHISLLFLAESLVRFAQWKYNEKKDMKEKVTHGQVVSLLFHTPCEVRAESKDSIQVYFDTTIQKYANFLELYWPRNLTMEWFDIHNNRDLAPLSG